MRWRTKDKDGDKRIVQRFLFFPHDCSDGYTYWLCFATFEQTFYDNQGGKCWLTDYTTMQPVEWVD